MANRDEVRDFLTTRRERLTPEQAGVPIFGGKRRVKGLRREEVAMLAGMSTDYYTRLERGNLTGVSHPVLEALARALQLDEAERAHLFDLADTANSSGQTATGRSSRRSAGRAGIRPGVQRILDTIHAPAYVRNGRMDILATNRLGRALFADADAYGSGFNLARFLFLDARSQDFYREWETVAADCVAALRTEAGRNPYDRGLTDMIGELSTRSEQFRTWWAAHNVKLHYTATKTMHHAIAGDLETVRSAGNTTVGVGVIPPAQTLLLRQALQAAGADSTHYLLSGAGHGRLSPSRRQASQWTSLQLMTVIKDFLDRHLRT